MGVPTAYGSSESFRVGSAEVYGIANPFCVGLGSGDEFPSPCFVGERCERGEGERLPEKSSVETDSSTGGIAAGLLLARRSVALSDVLALCGMVWQRADWTLETAAHAGTGRL